MTASPSQINAITDLVDAVLDRGIMTAAYVEILISIAAGVSVELHEYDDLTVEQADAVIARLGRELV